MKPEPRKLRLQREVRGDYPFAHTTIAKPRIYDPDEISVNPHGAVSVRATNGKWLGIKPDEMEWL